MFFFIIFSFLFILKEAEEDILLSMLRGALAMPGLYFSYTSDITRTSQAAELAAVDAKVTFYFVCF